jgi:hypothetical protein
MISLLHSAQTATRTEVYLGAAIDPIFPRLVSLGFRRSVERDH